MNKGLTSFQAKQRLSDYGQNIIEGKKKDTIWRKFFEQLSNFLTVLLLSAAGVSFFIGEFVDGLLIIIIVLLNAIFGVYQEKKAEEAVEMLKKLTIATIRVIRDGKEIEIDSKFLVPGDVFYIEEGVKVPADAKLIEIHNLEINEAALTGESIPVVKAEGHDVFMGTITSKGRGLAEVTKTGMRTKFGQIAAELSSLEEMKTPLQKKLEQLTEIIGLVGIVISLGVFALSSIQGYGYFPSFLLAVSLAVAVVPEGLPAVMTITLAVGVKAMAAKKAIVRKMAAIEALGNVTLIATDKTGTLTTNKMEVKEVWVDETVHELTQTDILKKSATFKHIVENGILCSTASLVYSHESQAFDILGDPTEGALLLMAKEVQKEPEVFRKEFPLIDEWPFESVTKRMSVKISYEGKERIYTKGAPESVLDICTSIEINGKVQPLTLEKKEKIYDVLEEWATKGLRVLGFSYGSTSHKQEHVFLGLVAIHDPPRPEAADSLQRAQTAGIRVVMITGDNEKTGEAIGTAIGLMQPGDIILRGEQVEKYTDEELMALLPKVKIFARTTPFHKSRIVSLYQKLGEVVVVTGDGVNDAIALKQADVGVAMGKVGTDVARETADMVITDDNFATIVNAVEEGRNIVKNLKNAIKYLLTGNLAEALTLVIGLIIGLPPLLAPIQILYINLISDGIPALALAFSPREENIMQRKPEKKLQLLSVLEMKYILSIGLISSLLVISSYFFIGISEGQKTTAAFSILAILQSFIFVDMWLSHRPIRHNYRVLISRFFIAAFLLPIFSQYILISVPFLRTMFHLETISLSHFALYILVASTSIFLIKIVKVLLGINAVQKKSRVSDSRR